MGIDAGLGLLLVPLGLLAITDLHWHKIPNLFVLSILPLALLRINTGYLPLWESLCAGLSMLVLLLPLSLNEHGGGLGGGDIKLLAAFGFTLGLPCIFVTIPAFVFPFFLRKRIKKAPLAPFLLLSFLGYLIGK